MTTPFYSSRTTPGSGVQPRTPLGLCSVSGEYTTLVDLIDEDVINLVKLPAGATVLEVILDVPPLTDAASGAWDLGDATVTGRFIAGGTAGQSSTGAIVRLTVVGSSQYKYTVDTFIQFQVKTVPGATQAQGTIKLTVIYTMDL
jgi:hypothetical protein